MASAAPENAPLTMRTANDGGALRLGVLGSLSFTNSAIASRLKMYGVAEEPRNAAQVLDRSNHLRRAAQLTTVGAVSARRPAITPTANDRASTEVVFTAAGYLDAATGIKESTACKTFSGRARTRISSVRFTQRTVPVESTRNSAGRAMSWSLIPARACSTPKRRITSALGSESKGNV